jgi:hypothetical protein
LKQLRRARLRDLPATWTAPQFDFMMAYWGDACAICGRTAQEGLCIAKDHWIPITHHDCPGTVAHNMLPLCQGKGGCNNRKGKTHPERWLIAHFRPEQAMIILASITAYFADVHRTFPVQELKTL